MRPFKNPIRLIQEGLNTCGADCAPDGCIGFDEVWSFYAEGNLKESFTYIAPQPTCHAFSKVEVKADVRRGKASLLVEIDMWDTLNSWHEDGIGSASIVTPRGDGHGKKYWTATVTNLTKKTAKRVQFTGFNNGTPRWRVV